jgi:hypothetical protein
MSRSKTSIKGKTPAVIDDKHPEFENMVNEYLSSIERDASHCENTNMAPLLRPLYSKYYKTPGYEKVIEEARRIYNNNKEEFNKESAEKVEERQPKRDKEGCSIMGGSRKKRGQKTRQNKKRRGHKSQRNKR